MVKQTKSRILRFLTVIEVFWKGYLKEVGVEEKPKMQYICLHLV